MFNLIWQKTVRKILPLILIIAVTFGVTLVMVQPTSAKPQGIVLQVNKLPPESQVLIDSEVKPDDPSHPLFRSESEGKTFGFSISTNDQIAITSYESVRALSVLVPSSGIVMNFSYQFKTGDDAQNAAKILRDEFAKSSKLIEARNLQGGRGYIFNGDEGDSVYWFVGTKESSLSLVLVNGIGKDKVAGLFEATVLEFANQNIDPVQ
jgi:hypothetical protein